ncbi:hypothetical protein CBW53_06295 [Yersinia frederiksenii]|nr:hypothetical protein CBW53_06295 [Yersinia frederiksenii]
MSKSKTSLVDPLHEYYQYWTYQFYFLLYGFTLQADIHGNEQKKMITMVWLFSYRWLTKTGLTTFYLPPFTSAPLQLLWGE